MDATSLLFLLPLAFTHGVAFKYIMHAMDHYREKTGRERSPAVAVAKHHSLSITPLLQSKQILWY